MIYQKTLRKGIGCSGVGLHSGKAVNITVRPALPDTGIVFRRIDIPGTPAVRALCDFVSDTRLATTIKKGTAIISTIEHLMAAFAVLRVDNAVVEIDGPEVPIMDGSATYFVDLIKKVGCLDQEGFRRYILVTRPVEVEHKGSTASISPSVESRISCYIDFNHEALGPQSFSCSVLCGGFEKEISEARTFGFLKEIEMLRANGLALGGSLDNAIVIDESGVINEGGLRFPDEFVRHKVLDSLGDLYLAGAPIIGHFVSNKGGHALTHRLLTKLLSSMESWEYITFTRNSDGRKSLKNRH